MTKLEKLIKELCPDGVDYRKIGDLATYEQPSKYIVHSTDYNDDFDIPVLTAGQSFILGYTNETDGLYKATKEDPVIIFDDFTGAFKWVNFTFKVKSSAMKMIKANTEITSLRYLFHLMGFLNFTSSEHKRLWISTYSEFMVPVPPLEVQREIVRILDNFTELTAELNEKLAAELTTRNKQYEYYRDSVLTFGDAVPTVKLKDVCISVKDGMHNLPKNSTEKGEFPILSAANINNGTIDYNAKRYVDEEVFNVENKRTNVEIGDVLLTIVATIGRTAVVNSNPNFLLQRSVCVLKVNKKILPGFLKCCLDTQKNQRNMIANAHGSAQAGLYLNQVAEIEIPLPPLEEQERIIEILDRFDALCNDILDGLSAEIEARQKQYEYYRDKLLTFKELSV